jgi:taurine dioxygenase
MTTARPLAAVTIPQAWRRSPVGVRVLHRTGEGRETFVPTRFGLEPQGATLGAWVRGLDLREPLDAEVVGELLAAWKEWKVLFFADQHLDIDQHARFASLWGALTDDHLDMHTSASSSDNVVVFTRDETTAGLENGWHSDGTFRAMPTSGTTLRAIEVPAQGGDTMFVDMAAAFDNLAPEVRELLSGRRARHDWSLGGYAGKYADDLAELRRRHPPVDHPVVILHPTTGRPTLFVNSLFTDRIIGLPDTLGEALLAHLLQQATTPEYQVRLHWEPGTLALWDNVAVQHYGVNDYFPQRRVMARATFLLGDHAAIVPWEKH